MTDRVYKERTRGARGVLSALVSVALILLLIGVAVFASGPLGGYIREGLSLAVERVLPTALPFMILSGFVGKMIDPDSLPLLGTLFEKVMCVPRSAFGAFLIGNLTGFPVGAKMTSELYRDGLIDKDSAERLLAYSDNPSFPFVTATVGSALLGDGTLGVILLVSVALGTVLSAQFFREKWQKIPFSQENTRQRYDFVASVKSSAQACLSMAAFISIFFCVVGIIRDYVDLAPLKMLLMLPVEITGVLSEICTDTSLSIILRCALAGFALGFGGISVMLQVSSFSSEVGLSMKKYLLIKLYEGFITALIASVLTGAYYLLAR